MTTQNTVEEWLTPPAAARYCASRGVSIHRATLRIYGLTRRIKSRRWKRYVELHRPALDRWLAEQVSNRTSAA